MYLEEIDSDGVLRCVSDRTENKVEIYKNGLKEVHTELMKIINDIRGDNYGIAKLRAESLREKISKLI